MKDELGRKTMKEFVGLGAKPYSYLIDDGSENQKKQQKVQKVPPLKENLKIIKTDQKQFKLKIKKTIQKKIKLM